MTLTQVGDRVTGTYVMEGVTGTIEGTLKDGVLSFKYRELDTTGKGSFKLSEDGGSFAGRWREDGSERIHPWVGQRSSQHAEGKDFAGLWDSRFGRMRLVKDGARIHGIYSLASVSSLSGKVVKEKGNRFVFRYKEPDTEGEGWFELVDGGESLRGQWKPDGSETWREWTATRIQPQRGLEWLVVVEARWESSLADQEHAFGDMLKAFFNRSSNVQVRRRFFNDENDLRRWVRETAFLAEPVVLCIATHGNTKGVEFSGETISPETIAASLKYSGTVQLLHFSACLMMKDRAAEKIMKQLGSQAEFPISGYATSVDWTASAVIDFLYFDLILSRNTAPEKAAERRIPKAVLSPAGFRTLTPNRAHQDSESVTYGHLGKFEQPKNCLPALSPSSPFTEQVRRRTWDNSHCLFC